MEITMTELFLFVWATLATGYALKYQAEFRAARRFAIALIDNPKMYSEITKSIDSIKKEAQNV